jgi:hypothetical protein
MLLLILKLVKFAKKCFLDEFIFSVNCQESVPLFKGLSFILFKFAQFENPWFGDLDIVCFTLQV